MFSETIEELAIASGLFLVTHFVLSSNPLRAKLIARLGEGRFRGIYSLIAAITFIWMNLAFAYAPFRDIWLPGDWTVILSIALMPVACILLVGGFLAQYARKDPMAAINPQLEAGKGIFSVSRHPILVALGLWAALHLTATGDLSAVIFFGSFVVLTVFGALHIDTRKAAEFPERWSKVMATTSAVPFAAVISGRAKIDWAGLGAPTLIGGILLYFIFLFGHDYVIGIIPWPAWS